MLKRPTHDKVELLQNGGNDLQTANCIIEYLSWDTDFFKKKIGRIFASKVDNLQDILKAAKKDCYQLIYIIGSQDFVINDEILYSYKGKLADRKVLYGKHIESVQKPASFVSEYTSRELTPELEKLAYLSGEYSRFKLDENFAPDDFYRMYRVWIENSLNKKIADFVFVAEENEQIKGMVTLNIAGEIGHIGLIAVSPETQGKGFGKTLIQKCEHELLARKIFTLEVPTQMDNKNACRFYEKCGFKIKEINNIYHFWL